MPIEDYEGFVDEDEDVAYNEASLDPAWEQQQKKTFTAWCNAHLKKASEQIEDITVDLRNGRNLMKLLEVISGEKLPKPEKGKMRFHKIANVNKSLDFIESKGVKLVSIGAAEIVDGNVKMTLGMIWTIILRFSIQNILIEDTSAKDGLLLWCKRQTAPYGINVDNFSTSFKDGRAFCAIINRNRPELLSFDVLNKETPLANLNLAFDAAEKLDIPRMLDAEDMVKSIKPDERSVMAYVSTMYHRLGTNKKAVAVQRLTNVLKPFRENERLVELCELLSDGLLKWLLKKLQYFQLRTPLLSVEQAEGLQMETRNYFCQEKPDRQEEKARLETTYNTLQTRLRLFNRLTCVPATEKSIAAIDERWNELEVADKSFEVWILGELQRLRRLEYLISKFENRCRTHELWAKGKPEYLANKDYLSANLPEVRAMKKKLEAFQSELVANDDRIERIQVLRGELRDVQYHDMDAVERRFSSIVYNTDNIKKLSDFRNGELDRLLIILDEADTLHLEFAKKAAPFKNWMDQTAEDLHDTLIVHNMAEVKRLMHENRVFNETLANAKAENMNIRDCASKVEDLARRHQLPHLIENPYTDIIPNSQELMEHWLKIQDLAAKRSRWLANEEKRQKEIDVLRTNFASKAAKFHDWVEKQKKQIHRTAVEASGTLNDQRDRLKEIEVLLQQHRSLLDELEQCNQELEDAYVFDNSATSYTMPTLRIVWNQLFSSLQHAISEVGNQILVAESKGLTPEEIKDLSECFKHFDKDDSGRLEPKEFKSCLVSVGHQFKDDFSVSVNDNSNNNNEAKANEVLHNFDVKDFNRIMKEVDPARRGYVTFDAFLKYMARQNVDDNVEDQVNQSFKTIAGDKDYVTAEDIRTNLPPEDANYCLRHMTPQNDPMGDFGALNYNQFAVFLHTPRGAA